MQNITGQSKDIVAENIIKIKEIFPEVFCEDKIDFERLQEVLGEYIEDKEERYRFEWNGKSKAIRLAQTPSIGTLRPCKEESKNWDTTENLYIEGDNLEVLKLLQKTYHNSIKMIYIDPPYNTGKDFVYSDNYRDSLKNYFIITRQIDETGNKVSSNSETNGRYHTDWLNMIYPRLRLARNLLTDDGVIFISIDDTELSNMKKICDEIFGEVNFIAQTIRVSNSAKNNSKFISTTHDYCLIYSKNKEILSSEVWRVKKNNIDEFLTRINRLKKLNLSNENISKEIRQLVKYPRFYDFDHYYYVDDRGVFRTDNAGGVANGNKDTIIIHPKTNKVCTMPEKGWRYSEETIRKMEDEGMWYFGNDEKTIPLPKRYLHDYHYQVPTGIHFYDSQMDAKNLQNENIPFDFPKPIDYIMLLLSMTTSSDSIIMDFFSGSSTTAHAIMKLNLEDGSKRKFIMVQLPEETNVKSNAYKKGYKNICEIGKERIRRAGEKILEENKDKEGIEDLDFGFKVFKLDSSNLKKWNPDYDNIEKTLDDMIGNFVDGRTEEDVLYEIMLKYGIDLTYPIETSAVDGRKVFIIGCGALFICLDSNITTDIADYIVREKDRLNPSTTRVVFKDNGFQSDSVKTNIIQILKRNGIDEIMSV